MNALPRNDMGADAVLANDRFHCNGDVDLWHRWKPRGRYSQLSTRTVVSAVMLLRRLGQRDVISQKPSTIQTLLLMTSPRMAR